MEGQTVYFEAISNLDNGLIESLKKISSQAAAAASEIRLISGHYPAVLSDGNIIRIFDSIIIPEQLNNSLISLCKGSVHSFQRQLAYGYITLEGGHRAGFAATAVYDTKGNLNGFRNVSAIVIRIARNFEGISVPLINKTFSKGASGLLIAGAPSTGKTTMLRDMAKQLSAGVISGLDRIAVIDERGELYDCGECTVLKGYDKSQGMLIALRNLSPQLLICDEIGSMSEALAVEQALNSGVYVITTVHSSSRSELLKRPVTSKLLSSRAFKNIVILSDKPAPCSVKEVIRCDELLDKAIRNSDDFDELYAVRDNECFSM